jgi:hypothetical protein
MMIKPASGSGRGRCRDPNRRRWTPGRMRGRHEDDEAVGQDHCELVDHGQRAV